MTTLSDPWGTVGTPSNDARDGRIADIDRRWYAFAIDRLIAWSVDLAVAVVVSRTLLAHDHVLARG